MACTASCHNLVFWAYLLRTEKGFEEVSISVSKGDLMHIEEGLRIN